MASAPQKVSRYHELSKDNHAPCASGPGGNRGADPLREFHPRLSKGRSQEHLPFWAARSGRNHAWQLYSKRPQ